MAKLAKPGRLNRFSDLLMIGRFGKEFGKDPDWVFSRTSFGTLIEFTVAWKEQHEFDERFDDIYRELSK